MFFPEDIRLCGIYKLCYYLFVEYQYYFFLTKKVSNRNIVSHLLKKSLMENFTFCAVILLDLHMHFIHFIIIAILLPDKFLSFLIRIHFE